MVSLSSLDYFGKSYKFKIDGGKLKTNFGAILSISLVLGMLGIIWFFGKELYEKKFPSMLTKTELLDYQPVINNFNWSSLVFAFKAEYNKAPIDPRFIELYAYQSQKFRNMTSNKLEK